MLLYYNSTISLASFYLFVLLSSTAQRIRQVVNIVLVRCRQLGFDGRSLVSWQLANRVFVLGLVKREGVIQFQCRTSFTQRKLFFRKHTDHRLFVILVDDYNK